MRDLYKLFAAGAVIVALAIGFMSMSEAAEDRPEGTGLFDKMKVANPIIQCNTMAIAYANGIYGYGEGLENPSLVEIPPQVIDADGKLLFVSLYVSGWHLARGYLEGSEMERKLAMEIAPDFYRKLEKACKATQGDMTLIISKLPNMGEYALEFIQRLEENTNGRRL